ncbi:MAG: hypothetical protein JOZ19_02945 [Rubrobacter sp.]|nr:hypothetical protein [Rubrobacter sp.]
MDAVVFRLEPVGHVGYVNNPSWVYMNFAVPTRLPYASLSDALASLILVYAVFAAITQLSIAIELTAPTFLILLGAIALALAIAFGIGGREVARDMVEKAYNRGAQTRRREQPSP